MKQAKLYHYPLFLIGHKKANFIPLKEVITAKHEHGKHKCSQPSSSKGQGAKAKDTTHLYIELQCPSFVVYMLSRGSKHKWKYKQLSFVCQDSHLCNQWVRNINEILSNAGNILMTVHVFGRVRVMVRCLMPLSTIFSVILWRSVFLVEETRVHRENHPPAKLCL